MPVQVLMGVAADPDWIRTALGILAVPVLVALNGLFVAAEFALVAVRRTRVEEMVAHKVKGAKPLGFAVENLDRFIAATQLGITLASIALGWIGEPAIADLLEWAFASFAFSHDLIHSTAFVIAFVAITFMHVVFGELIPKTLAIQNPDQTALWVARPLVVFARLTRPLVLLMNGTANWILARFGYLDADETSLVHSVEELALLIEDTEEAGILEPEQAEVVQNVFRLSSKHVGDCMVPRERMNAIGINSPPEKVLETVRQSAHTRMPVYEGNLDNIVGLVNTKDLFYLFSLQGVVVLADAMYPAIFLGPEDSLGDAVSLFKRTRRHLAVVRNDQDKVVGLITLEDILEEIVGEIEDEHDQPANPRLKTWRTKLKRRRAAPPSTPNAPAPAPK